MTRHAHPKVHLELSSLFGLLFNVKFEVANPFLLLTKREVVNELSSYLNDGERLEKILQSTETCWNLNSQNVIGGVTKRNGQPCGICIPCLVRGSSLPSDPIGARANFSQRPDELKAVPEARVHVDAYIYWAENFLRKDYTIDQFMYDAPYPIREALRSSPDVLDDSAIFDLYQRFAQEVCDSYPKVGV